MTPAEYVQQLECLSDEGDPDAILAFSEQYGWLVDDDLTQQQRSLEADIVHGAAMLVGLRGAVTAAISKPPSE